MNIKNWFKNNIYNIIVFLLLILFGIFYWRTVMFLPLFGDATIHGWHTKTILYEGWQKLSADYPSFYYYIVGDLWQFFGEKGYNLLVYISIFLILIYSYLLAYKVSGKKQIGILIMVIVGFSSKLIFYSARLYQEIFITALFLMSFYYLYLFIKGNFKDKKNFYLLVFLVGITLSIKQQGLFILYPSILLFFIILTVLKKLNFKQLIIFFLIPLIIGIGAYGVLFHTKGRIVIGNEDFKILNIINYFGQKLFNYSGEEYKLKNFNYTLNYSDYIKNKKVDNIVNDELDKKLLKIQDDYYRNGTKRAEARHIYFTDVFKNYKKFNEANNLYNFSFGYKKFEWLYDLLFIFFISGLLIFILKELKKDKRNIYLFIFLIIFLGINYYLFQRNTDQARYHLFIPFYVLFFIIIFLKFIYKNKFFYIFISFILIGLITTSYSFFEKNRLAIRGQIYAPSRGGIPSIIETGKWINNNLSKNTKYFQMCGNELSYYSNRKVIGDWKIYFLSNKDLLKYFKNKNLKYFVLFNSQVVSDDKWSNLCKIPQSFKEKLKKNFDLIFTSSKEDIRVYKLKNINEKNTFN